MKIDKVLLETFKAKDGDVKGQYDCSVCAIMDNEVYEVSFKTQTSAIAINIEENTETYRSPHDFYINMFPRAQMVLPIVTNYNEMLNGESLFTIKKMEAIKK